MRIDTIARGSHCFELKRSGTTLLHANGHRYVWFTLFRAEVKLNKLVACDGHRYAWLPLFGVETNWKKLVECEWTWLRVVRTVWS